MSKESYESSGVFGELPNTDESSQKYYLQAKSIFLAGDFDSTADFFINNGFILEYGYSKLLTGDTDLAKKEFSKISEQDLRADWAKKLIQFIEGYVVQVPSFFQVRNFLEIDLNLLLQAKRPEFVENIINGADLFYSVNPESYKFIARVMLYNDFTGVALHYLLKAKDKFYYDPEMHLMLASCYIKNGEPILARKAVNSCLDMLPDYFPARRLLEQL